MNALKVGRIALQVLILAMIGACAGGGGGGGGGSVVSPPPPPPPPPPSPPPPLPPPGTIPSATSSEYLANWAVAGTNARVAWQAGSTGQGVLIGVIDDGIDPNHPELVGRVDTVNSTDIVAGRNALTTTLSHGSELGSLIAGNFNNSQTVGLAFGATLLAVRADNASGTFNDDDLANAINYAVSKGVRVINLSLGKPGPVTANMLQAITNATNAGVIFTVSAGNIGQQGATEVNYPAFYASNTAVSHGLIMIGGGLNQNGTLNTVSNPPGQNLNYYLTAPGWSIIVPDHGPVGPVPGFQTCGLGANGDLCQIQGTSYASPQIAGAVALVMAAFPGMTPSQVVDLLLTTADDTGATGTDALMGRGRLNIGRAFGPVGPLSAPLMGNRVAVTPQSLLGMAGPAFGDGLIDDAHEWAMVGFDKYDRAFTIDFNDNWVSAAAGPALIAQAPLLWRNARTEQGVSMSFAQADSVAPESYRLALGREDLERPAVKIEGEIMPGLTMTFAANGPQSLRGDMDASVGHLGFVNADASMTLTRELTPFARLSLVSETGQARVGLQQQTSDRSATAARLGFGTEALGLDVTFGQIDDEHGLLGMVWADTFGETPPGEIHFAGLAAHLQPAPRWRVSIEAETGTAEMRHPGWLTQGAPIRTSAYDLEASYQTPWLDLLGVPGAGVVTFSMSQPLRVEDGTFLASLPTATPFGRRTLRFETREIDTTPSGRELRLGVGYRYYVGDWLSAFGEALYVNQPGHVANADADGIVRVGVRLRN